MSQIKASPLPKSTSYEYGFSHQQQMETFYWKSKQPSDSNHEYNRIMLAESLVKNVVTDIFDKPPDNGSITLLDIGCSVGLFAIHFSKLGYSTIGIDFDPAAIEIAEKLNAIDNGAGKFVLGDLGNGLPDLPPIDIALCFDIFEHLHDDELGSLMQSLKQRLSPRGVVVFHTNPQQYDYIFWNKKKRIIEFPFLLKPFSYLSPSTFSKLVRIYALLVDIALVILTNKICKERIKKAGHCNPLTVERLTDMLSRANYDILELQSGFITDQFKPSAKERFKKHQITHRSIYGIARPKR